MKVISLLLVALIIVLKMPAKAVEIAASVSVVSGTSICIGFAGIAVLMVDGSAGYANLQEEVAE